MSFNRQFRATPIKLGERYRQKARKERLRRIMLPMFVLAGTICIGGAYGIVSARTDTATETANAIAYEDTLSGCKVTDGDTIRCNGERIRLLAIDSAELPGHCRKGRVCASGDPYRASASLDAALVGKLRITRFGTDLYGRSLAVVIGDKGDLSCWQLRHGHAIYKAAWDERGRIAATCPNVAR